MVGAEPWIASYIPTVVAPSDAEGITPMLPTIAAVRSERMSPKRLDVSTTSNCEGLRASCIAALSTYIIESATVG